MSETILTLGDTPNSDRYLTLGRAIARQCPTGFEEAKLVADLDADPTVRSLNWTAPDGTTGEIGVGPAAETEIGGLLREIRTAMASEEGGQSFRRATVTLRSGGRFRIDVE
jgi:hypothetical protein